MNGGIIIDGGGGIGFLGGCSVDDGDCDLKALWKLDALDEIHSCGDCLIC